jgi:hypothetical protein
MMVKDTKVLPVGLFVEGELSLSWMQSFQAHSCLYFVYSFHSFIFFFVQNLIRVHCLGMVTRADNITHKYFHRDEKVGS